MGTETPYSTSDQGAACHAASSAGSPRTTAAATAGADPVNAALYSVWHAARLAQLSRPTVRRWLTGKQLSSREAKSAIMQPPFRPGSLRRPPDMHRLTFGEVLTLRVVKGLRATGCTLWTIRRIAIMAEAEFGCHAPMATQRFRAEGAFLFLRIDEATQYMHAQEAADTGRDPIAVMVWQNVFQDVVDRILFRNIDWKAGMAARWWPLGRDAGIVIDPGLARGMPHIAATGVRTATMTSTVRQADGDEAAIAASCGLTPQQVRNAVRFETEWQAKW